MKKRPFLSREKLLAIVKNQPTPFHIYDEKGVRETARALRAAFSWNPGFKEYFAVKATPNPSILDILKEEGCGVDCSSYTELQMASVCGFSGAEIMFSSNVTPPEDYRLAHQLGATINLDDISHIEYLRDLIGNLPKRMSCRFNPGGIFQVSNDIMDNPGDAKYGFTRSQMVEGFRLLKKYGVESFGIHAFLVSNAVTEAYYPKLAETLFELAVELQHETGAQIDFINLSGGIGIPYRPEQEPADIAAIGDGVRRAYEKILVPNGMGHIAIYTELGRYMLGSNGALIATVLHKKDTYKHYVGLDACAANLMRPAMYGAYHHITVMGKEDEPCTEVYDVTGGLCENNDKFAVDRHLPPIEIGDLIYIHDTGAHGFSMGYNYNGKLRSAEILLCENGATKLIRRAEQPADYFATFDFTHRFEHLPEAEPSARKRGG